MPTRRTSILARPGTMSKALVAYLQALPELEIVRWEEEPQAILDALRQEGGDILVIYDEHSDWGLKSYVATIRQAAPFINCIVIMPDLDSRKILINSGASTVLQRGLLDGNLHDALFGKSIHPGGWDPAPNQ